MTCWCCCCWWWCCWLRSRGGEIGSFLTLMEEEEGEWEFDGAWGLFVDTVNWPNWPPLALPPLLLPVLDWFPVSPIAFNWFWFEAQLWIVNPPWELNTSPPVKSLALNWNSSIFKKKERMEMSFNFYSKNVDHIFEPQRKGERVWWPSFGYRRGNARVTFTQALSLKEMKAETKWRVEKVSRESTYCCWTIVRTDNQGYPIDMSHSRENWSSSHFARPAYPFHKHTLSKSESEGCEIRSNYDNDLSKGLPC